MRAITLLLLSTSAVSQAALLPTEVYYNGPLAGSDPDEFLELTNASDDPIALEGYRFAEGLSFTFGAFSLQAGASLVIAPNSAGFRQRFPEFTGTLFDAGGALSNGGERITLASQLGDTIFSFAYDDGPSWPQAADGAGASLELAGLELPLDDGSSWRAADPSPGLWPYLPTVEPDRDAGDPVHEAPNRIPAPGGTALLGLGLALMKLRRRPIRTQR